MMRLTWRQAIVELGWRDCPASVKALKRAVARGVRAGRSDPRVDYRHITLEGLFRCVPALEPDEVTRELRQAWSDARERTRATVSGRERP